MEACSSMSLKIFFKVKLFYWVACREKGDIQRG